MVCHRRDWSKVRDWQGWRLRFLRCCLQILITCHRCLAVRLPDHRAASNKRHECSFWCQSWTACHSRTTNTYFRPSYTTRYWRLWLVQSQGANSISYSTSLSKGCKPGQYQHLRQTDLCRVSPAAWKGIKCRSSRGKRNINSIT